MCRGPGFGLMFSQPSFRKEYLLFSAAAKKTSLAHVCPIDRDAKDRDAKDRDAKDRDAKDRDAKDRSRRERGERERGWPARSAAPAGGTHTKTAAVPLEGRGRHSFLPVHPAERIGVRVWLFTGTGTARPHSRWCWPGLSPQSRF